MRLIASVLFGTGVLRTFAMVPDKIGRGWKPLLQRRGVPFARDGLYGSIRGARLSIPLWCSIIAVILPLASRWNVSCASTTL